jgi:exonuclease III
VVEQDLLYLTLLGYLLGSRFCRLKLQRGGVCIFVRNDQCFNKIEVLHHCKEQDLGICAIHLETKTCNLIIISLYRAPLGDFIQFLRTLGTTLKYLYDPKSEFVICGDVNIDYLDESRKNKLIINNI